MRTFPLCRVMRSFDGCRWEPLSDADTRQLFEQLALAREFALGAAGDPLYPFTRLLEWEAPEYVQPQDVVSEVVQRVEQGLTARLQLGEGVELHLRACFMPSDSAQVPLTRRA